MYQEMSTKVVDLTPYLARVQWEERQTRRWETAYSLLALWTQYLSLGALLLYGALRSFLCPGVPLGAYSGPLALLWPVSFFLLLTSFLSDKLLWREEAD